MNDNNIDVMLSMVVYEIKPRVINPRSFQEIEIGNGDDKVKQSIIKGDNWNFPPANEIVMKNIFRDKRKLGKRGNNLGINDKLKNYVNDYKKAIKIEDKNYEKTFPNNYKIEHNKFKGKNEEQDTIELLNLKIVKRGIGTYEGETDEIIEKTVSFQKVGDTNKTIDINILFEKVEEFKKVSTQHNDLFKKLGLKSGKIFKSKFIKYVKEGTKDKIKILKVDGITREEWKTLGWKGRNANVFPCAGTNF